MKVTVYGDSILKGVLFENGKYVVERKWQDALTERFGLRIANRSRFGSTLPKAMARIEKDSAEQTEDEYAPIEDDAPVEDAEA